MSHRRKKICLFCYTPFEGRRDAKTCSDRCRKGLQRSKVMYEEAARVAEQQNGYMGRHYMGAIRQRGYYAEQ